MNSVNNKFLFIVWIILALPLTAYLSIYSWENISVAMQLQKDIDHFQLMAATENDGVGSYKKAYREIADSKTQIQYKSYLKFIGYSLVYLLIITLPFTYTNIRLRFNHLKSWLKIRLGLHELGNTVGVTDNDKFIGLTSSHTNQHKWINRKILITIITVVITTLAISYYVNVYRPSSLKALTEKAEITSRCQLSGTGEIECTFKNAGKAKGSLCHHIGLIRDGSDAHLNTFDYIAAQGGGLSDSEICSGIVEAGDIRQTKSYMGFGTNKLSPREMCSIGRVAWTDRCGFVIVQ